jgi:diketogulonate reductase-like aldo/keto reductase
MLKRKFGWTGVEVAMIGQGTWMIEGGRETESRAVEALRLGLDLGVTHIDTAEDVWRWPYRGIGCRSHSWTTRPGVFS